MGSATRDASAHTTGSPSPQPGRSQPWGGAPGGSSSRIGSSAAGGPASGPNPNRPPSQNRPATTSEPMPSAMASRSGVIESDPRVITSSTLPVARAAKNTSAARAPGTMTANRISASVQAIGWTTATTTESSVSATMMNRNVRFPNPGSPPGVAAGTLIAIYPRTLVMPISPTIARTRPSALRIRISSSSAPIAYAATHLLARASPSRTPISGIANQNAPRPRHQPVHTAAKTVYAAMMKSPT